MEREQDTKPQYSIGEIAEKTGISRRTVRYYVQRGLIDPPVGRGRGSGYTGQHVEQILCVLRLQREGLGLEAIQQLPQQAFVGAHPAAVRHPPTVVFRVPLIPGVRLELDAGLRPPGPAVVDALAEACAKILESNKEAG
jgi:DNA-binding transcriptional MerR regulator